MKRYGVLLIVLTALWVISPPGARAGCESEIKSTQASLTTTEARLDEVDAKKRSRIVSFIDGAKRMLAEAESDCRQDATGLDRATATGKALIAQGHLAAAQLLIKAN